MSRAHARLRVLVSSGTQTTITIEATNSVDVRMPVQRFVLAIFAIGWAVHAASAQAKLAKGRVEAGRALALRACSGCHVVASDQPFQPIYAGPPRPPDFKEIASRSNVTAASLQRHLQTLPAVPKNLRMANPLLSSEEGRDVVAFIISLRDKPATPTQPR